MSVAFQTNSNRIRHSDFAQNMWIYNSSDEHHRTNNNNFAIGKDQEDHDSTSSSSSIGNNSDASGGAAGDSDDDGGGGGEVQSLFKGSLNNLCDLENALPIKRGISTFYAGKSKSYTSLADAVSAPSIQDIVKPEDAYNRKRKNMIAHSVLLDKNRNFTSKTGISKRFANSNRGSLGLGLNKHDSHSVGETSTLTSLSSLSSSPGSSLPPLPARPRRLPTNEPTDSSSPRIYSTWRSFSLSDLQQAAGSTSSISNKRVDQDDDD